MHHKAPTSDLEQLQSNFVVSVSGIVCLEFEARAKETLNALYHVDGAQFWRIFSLRVMLSDL